MRKKIKRIRIKQNAKDIGVCFEPLEPRLLLSGSWGAGAEGPAPDFQLNPHGDFGSETVTLSKGPNTFGSDALLRNQHELGVGTFVDVLSNAPVLSVFDANDHVLEASSISDQTAPASGDTSSNGTESNPDLRPDLTAVAGARELVFVNENVADYQQLIADLQGGDDNRIIEVMVLDADREGIKQVSETLADRSDLAAVHFITHGAEGQINLGETWLTSATLQQNSHAVAAWGNALTESGDILFYGCKIAANSGGQNLLANIAKLTGADVAASDDLTGHDSQGGDWVLEYQAGTVETGVAFSLTAEDDWVSTLATYTVTNTNDSGDGSLRKAITDANTTVGADTIAFNIAGAGLHSITPASALPTISDAVLIDGYTQTGASANTLSVGDNAVLQIELNGTSAGGANGINLGAGSDGSTIRGLIINRFSLSGIQVNSANNLILGNFIGANSTGTSDLGNAFDGITVSADNNSIGSSAAADRNLISGNNDEPIDVDVGVTGTIIRGNYLGTNAAGTAAIANGTAGNANSGFLLIEGGNSIVGGQNPGEGNLVSGSTHAGIYITSTDNTVQGNLIGTDATGMTALANQGPGVRIGEIAGVQKGTDNLIGGTSASMHNVIAFNAGAGISLDSGAGNGNAFLGNSMHSNGALGIDLSNDGVTTNDPIDADTGPNNLQNYPVLTSAVTTGSQITITGTLNSMASTSFRIEFYANATGDATGYGEGQTLIGVQDVTTDGSGNAAISAVFPAALSAGSAISATATRLDAGDAPIETSEFSQNVIATATNVIWISPDQDAGPPGADGLPGGWREGEVLQFGGPDLTLGLATDGDFSSVIDFDIFTDTLTTGTTDPGALHFVSRALTIGSGANQFDLQIGDVLVSFNQDETILAAYYETGTDTTVHINDLLAFRPDTPGDYTSGTFYIVLNGVPDPLGAPINSLHAISLVEQDTYVGSTLLSAGSFIYSEQDGLAPNTPNHIYHFTATDAGQAAAAGTSQILIDGNDINIEVGSNIRGLDLIEKPITIGGMTFDSGDILVTLSIDDAAVGDAPSLNTSTSDIFVLKVSQSEPEPGNTTAATAVMVLDGSQVNFDGTERVYAISVVPDNYGPAVGGDTTGTVTEDVGVVGGNISDSGTLTIVDPNSGESSFVPETIVGTYGSLTIDAAGAWTYTADNSQAAIQSLKSSETLSDVLMVTTADGTTQRITITINGVNDAPTISAIGDQTIAEDGSTGALGFSVSDVETAAGALAVTAVSSNTTLIPNGNLTLVDLGSGNWTIEAAAAANENGGPVTITVTVDDGTTTTDETLDVTITADNDAPTTVGIADVTVAEDAPDSVIDLFAAFADAEDADAALIYTVTTNTNPALFTSTAIDGVAGTLTLDYAAAQSGTADITVRATDTGGLWIESTFTVTVNAVNDAPTTSGIADVTVAEDAPDSVIDLFAAFADAEDADAALTYTVTTNTNPALFTSTAVDGAAGTLTLDYAANQSGTADITVRATDTGGLFVETTFTVTVNAVNDAPLARPDGVHLSFDGDDFIRVADDPSLQMTNTVTMEAWINHSGTGTGTQIILNKEGEYEMAITADTGEIKYAIAGAAPTWNWHNTGHFVTSGEWTHVAVTYDAVAGEVKTFINGTLVETFGQSDPIGDVYPGWNELRIGDRENATDQRFQGLIDEVRVWNTTRTQGEIQANMNGLLTGAESGLVGNWRFNEGSGGVVVDQSASGNDGILGGSPATPSYEGYYTNEDTLLTVPAASGVLANDFDADGDALSVTNLDTTGMLGTLVLNPVDGSFTYDPRGVFNSLEAGEHVTETFTYTANDGFGNSNTTTATLTVTGVNDAPIATADSFTVNEGSTTILNLAANDTDADDGLDPNSINIISGPTNGSIVVNADGTVDYTHDGSEMVADSFTYTIDDLAGVTSNTVTVNLTITPVNDAPVAVADNFTVNEGSTTNLNLAANDSDADDGLDVTSIAIVSGPANGALVVNADGTVDYTHDGSETVADSFTYTIDDLAGVTSNTVTVNLTITPVNDAPVAVADNFTVTEGSTTNLTLAANDSDADDGLDVTSIAIVSGPANGALVVNADGTVDYTHNGSETVADSFTYTINDLSGATSNTVTVNLTVTPVNDTPTGSVTIDNMAPAEGDTLTASNTLADADGLSGPIGYQWYLDGIAIGGATGATYIAVPADVGGVITVVASYTDDQGTFESVSSGATAAVTNVNYAPTGSVTISGTPTEDQTLTASNTLADVDGMGPVSYQWQRDGVDIGGATGSTYILGDADVGTTITVIAGYTDGDGTNESVSSAGVGPIANVNDVPTTAPVTLASIAEDSGARLITQAELLVNAVDLDGDGLTATGLAIAGGNGSLVDNGDGSWTYTPAGNDDTSVSFSYTISDGTAGVAASATLDITPVNDAAVIDESPGPVDEGDGDPDPGDEGDPVATEPDEVLPIEEVLPPPEVMAIPNSRPLEMLDVTGAHWNRPRHFAATIALMKPEYVYRNDNGSPAVDVAFLNSFKREPASASEGNFVPAATVYFSPEVMAQALDHLQKQIDDTMELDVNQEQLIIGAATGLGASVMVGYVVWAFRGASLLLGALSAMPVWRCFDPLPVLIGNDKKRDEDAEEKSGEPESEDDEKRVRDLLDAEQTVNAHQAHNGRRN